jgi:Holliday junction resolvase RusA-like endonuclease
MLPFEFTIKGPPVSAQTRNRRRLQSWKSEVTSAAQRQLSASASIVGDEVSVTITYYYEGETPDVDNIIKPIQDALIGVIYNDDNQVVETKSRKRSINASYKIRGVSAVLLAAFADGNDFLHIKVCLAEVSEVLD